MVNTIFLKKSSQTQTKFKRLAKIWIKARDSDEHMSHQPETPPLSQEPL